MPEASAELGITNGLMKRLCRVYGIARWPFRKFNSLVLFKQSIEASESISEDGRKVRPMQNDNLKKAK